MVDLFAGAGGLSLGFEQAGFDVLAAVEYDPIHAMVHRYNFPECEVLCRDIKALSADDIRLAAARGARRIGRQNATEDGIDVVIGGPSCQGFSSMGRRKEDDDRNELLNEYVRIVSELKPRAFVLENVPGLLEPRFEEFRNAAFKNLRNAGYSLSGTDGWLDASDFGVPQVRKRVVVIGVLDGPAAELSPKDETVRRTVADALDGLPVIENYAALLESDSVVLTKADRNARLSARSLYARTLSGVADTTGLAKPRIWDPRQLTNSLRTVHTTKTIERFEATSPGTVEPVSRFFRLSLESPARTLRAGTGRERGAHTSPRPIHPVLPRVITVREAARLHGYPDWFRFASTNWHGHRQIGNSVPPPLAQAAGQAVLKALGARPRRPILERKLGDPSWLSMRPFNAAAFLDAVQTELPPLRWRN